MLQGILKQTVEEELKNRVKEKEIIPALLNIKEFCDYLGIGETKARELLHDPGNGFTVRIGIGCTLTGEKWINGC